MAQIRLQIVGERVIEIGKKRVTPGARKLFGALLFLGTEHHREVTRAELAELLYPARDPFSKSSHRLRQTLYNLKRMGAPITIGAETVRVDSGGVRSSVSELLSGSWELRKEHLTRSFEILPHYAPPSDTALVSWVELLRERLHYALRQQLTRDMGIARRNADWRYLEALARRTLELDPLNESAILALAEATARTGSKALALSVLRTYQSDLGDDQSSLALPATLLERRIDATRDHPVVNRRGPTPFIGRERDLANLLSMWQSARRGSAHAVSLTGNKSVGKSRLAEELAASVVIAGPSEVITLSLSPMDRDRPLSLFAALANRLSSLPGAAGCDPASLQALGRLSGSISLPTAVNPENTNSTFSDAAIRNAICDLVRCVSDERPVLVVVDDAQHLDDASAHLLEAMLGRVSDKRLLIVLCGPTDLPSPQPRHSTMHLEPLSADSSRELWQALLAAQDTPLAEELSRKCLDAAAGNPGHLSLLAQQAAQDPEHFLIPIDLITLTDLRLGQLSSHARYVLEAMVILDDAATTTSVAHLTGLATYDLLIALHLLETADLIVNTPTGFRCRSGLIAERVRAASASTPMSMMEARAAEYLEQAQSGERWSPSTAWRIASHWQRAGEPRRARAYLRACWQHAVSIGQPASASSAINDALRATSDPEDRASLLDDLIGSLKATGDLKEVIPTARERRSLSARVHDTPARIAQLAFDEDEAQWSRNVSPQVPVSSFRAHLESSLLDPQRRIRAARALMIAADGDLDPSLAAYTINSCGKITPNNPHSTLVLTYVNLIYHTIFGDLDRALQIADELQDKAKTVERSWYSLELERNCAFARQLAGTGASDYESLERGFAQALDASMTAIALWFAGSLMSVLVDDGDISGAQAWMLTAEQLAETLDGADLPIDYLGAQIDLSLLAGDRKKARRHLDLAEKCARYQSRRLRNDLFIYRLRIQQFFGTVSNPETHLERLLDYHEVAKGLTRHDDHMNVVWEALNAAGQPERASLLLEDYLLKHRRERRPCRHLLRLRTQSDPAWKQLKLLHATTQR